MRRSKEEDPCLIQNGGTRRLAPLVAALTTFSRQTRSLSVLTATRRRCRTVRVPNVDTTRAARFSTPKRPARLQSPFHFRLWSPVGAHRIDCDYGWHSRKGDGLRPGSKA